MNKKRKILTILSLAIFGAIIFFHYYSFDYRPAYEQTEYFVDRTGKPWLDAPVVGGPQVKLDPSTFPDKPTPKKRMTADEFRKKNARYPAGEKGEFVAVEYPAEGPYLTSYPGINEIRMPLFVLAVFYVGLFFILGPSAIKNRPS
jgi:hypothetical protein